MIRFPLKRISRNTGLDGAVTLGTMCDIDQDGDIDLFDIASYLGVPISGIIDGREFCYESAKGTIRVYAATCPLGPVEQFEPNQEILFLNCDVIKWWTGVWKHVTGPM